MSHLAEIKALIEAEWANQTGPVQTSITQGLSPSPTLKELLPAVPSSSGQLPPGILPPEECEPVLRRYKPPFDNTTKHDARGDALSICFDILIQKRLPSWAAHLISYEFVNEEDVQEKFKVANYELSDDKEYERINAFGWCRDIIHKFNDFMAEMAHGKRQIPESPPNFDKWPISFSANKNRKPKMEDRNCIVTTFACIEPGNDYEYKDDAFFGVFDGHNGQDVSAYLAAHFHRSFLKPCNADKDPMQRLQKAYEYTDKFLNLRCEKESHHGGSTAAGVLINEHTLYLFWCGDASIGLFHNNSVLTLSRPHVPTNEKEYERVVADGGTIVNVNGELRVNGVLNITRSMGELLGKPMISSEPEMSQREITEDDYLLFLASDGVWDELSASEIKKHCGNFAHKYPADHYVHLADYIVADCKRIGGRDNMTLIIVFLKPFDEVWAHLRGFSTEHTL
ncbi:PPM-type phosphatase domain-containing protein [Aphelenchoides bicaudatus]|nr:PPM-type phosphatase domain-containing protein [Aphelenchoides bicaudatus]